MPRAAAAGSAPEPRPSLSHAGNKKATRRWLFVESLKRLLLGSSSGFSGLLGGFSSSVSGRSSGRSRSSGSGHGGGSSSFGSGSSGSRSRCGSSSGGRSGRGRRLFLLATGGQGSSSNQGGDDERLVHFSFSLRTIKKTKNATTSSLLQPGSALAECTPWEHVYNSVGNYIGYSSILDYTEHCKNYPFVANN